uniref:Uncharacterized protein n=1 Tax=Tetranychus urticae TaxID=32264 RepID=T1JWG7_TETUR
MHRQKNIQPLDTRQENFVKIILNICKNQSLRPETRSQTLEINLIQGIKMIL